MGQANPGTWVKNGSAPTVARRRRNFLDLDVWTTAPALFGDWRRRHLNLLQRVGI